MRSLTGAIRSPVSEQTRTLPVACEAPLCRQHTLCAAVPLRNRRRHAAGRATTRSQTRSACIENVSRYPFPDMRKGLPCAMPQTAARQGAACCMTIACICCHSWLVHNCSLRVNPWHNSEYEGEPVPRIPLRPCVLSVGPGADGIAWPAVRASASRVRMCRDYLPWLVWKLLLPGGVLHLIYRSDGINFGGETSERPRKRMHSGIGQEPQAARRQLRPRPARKLAQTMQTLTHSRRSRIHNS